MIKDFSKYKTTCWIPLLNKCSGGEIRFIGYISPGRNKGWPLFSVIPDFTLGVKDPVLEEIKSSLPYYTLPVRERFVNELEIILSDLYNEKIKLT